VLGGPEVVRVCVSQQQHPLAKKRRLPNAVFVGADASLQSGTPMPKTVASRGSEQVGANPYERPKEVGTRWSQEEDQALRAAIEQHTTPKGPSWPLIAQTLGQLGFDRTVAMCRNRLSRMNADTSSSTRVCSLCGFSPIKGHTCKGGLDIARPSEATSMGPSLVITKFLAHSEKSSVVGDLDHVIIYQRICPLEACVRGAGDVPEVALRVSLIFADDGEPVPESDADNSPLIAAGADAMISPRSGIAAFPRLRLGKAVVHHKSRRFRLRLAPRDEGMRKELPWLCADSEPFQVKAIARHYRGTSVLPTANSVATHPPTSAVSSVAAVSSVVQLWEAADEFKWWAAAPPLEAQLPPLRTTTLPPPHARLSALGYNLSPCKLPKQQLHTTGLWYNLSPCKLDHATPPPGAQPLTIARGPPLTLADAGQRLLCIERSLTCRKGGAPKAEPEGGMPAPISAPDGFVTSTPISAPEGVVPAPGARGTSMQAAHDGAPKAARGPSVAKEEDDEEDEGSADESVCVGGACEGGVCDRDDADEAEADPMSTDAEDDADDDEQVDVVDFDFDSDAFDLDLDTDAKGSVCRSSSPSQCGEPSDGAVAEERMSPPSSQDSSFDWLPTSSQVEEFLDC
jgi:hypothetical protein